MICLEAMRPPPPLDADDVLATWEAEGRTVVIDRIELRCSGLVATGTVQLPPAADVAKLFSTIRIVSRSQL